MSGRKTRSIPPAIRRALRSRDAGCRFPGCTHTRFLDGHHIRHWADGGETKLSNLVMLCRFHHRQVHEGRVDVRMLDDGALRFTGTRGQQFEAAMSMAGDADQLACQHRIEGIAIDAATAVTRWCGERLDYDLAVGGLMLEQERGRRDVSAETLSRTPRAAQTEVRPLRRGASRPSPATCLPAAEVDRETALIVSHRGRWSSARRESIGGGVFSSIAERLFHGGGRRLRRTGRRGGKVDLRRTRGPLKNAHLSLAG